MANKNHISGFTLIELSIVLVIIGLVVGGILVGQDLIKAAKVRAQISQIEQYNTAANTFKLKYNYLPGDMPDPYASQAGFSRSGSNCGASGDTGCGNGNGVINNNSSGAQAGEANLFWQDLSRAGLISGTYSSIGLWKTEATVNIGNYYPKSKLGDNIYVIVYSGGWSESDNINYFNVVNIWAVGTTTQGYTRGTYSPYGTVSGYRGYSVSDAYNMDKKIDDGLPQSGQVLALGLVNSGIEWAGLEYWGAGYRNLSDNSPRAGASINGDDTSCYNQPSSVSGPMQYAIARNANSKNCILSFKFQ